MWFFKKPITFARKASIVTRNQRSLFKLVRNILIEDQHEVMYARPAYHVFDVDERTNSKSNIKKGRMMVGNAYLDIIVVENESLKAVCAFRMDENGDKKEKEWSKETRNLVKAAESAKFPLFIVPNTKTYSTAAIVAKINRIVPIKKPGSQKKPTADITQRPGVDGKDVDHNRREVNTFHKTKP